MHKAFEYLSKTEEEDKPDVRYVVKARRSDSANSQRGILLREPLDTFKPVSFLCEVQPKLHEVYLRLYLSLSDYIVVQQQQQTCCSIVKARCYCSANSHRSILLREPLDTFKPVTFLCEVQPKLCEVWS